jgi:hypothetical protein
VAKCKLAKQFLSKNPTNLCPRWELTEPNYLSTARKIPTSMMSGNDREIF